MRGAILPLPQYAFVAWCSVKAQGQLYLPYEWDKWKHRKSLRLNAIVFWSNKTYREGVNIRRFRDSVFICLRHQGLMIETVSETSDSYNELTRMTFREDFIANKITGSRNRSRDFPNANPITRSVYEGVSKSFRTESMNKYTLTFDTSRWEAIQTVVAAKLTRLTHKIVI
jgi:hypothetical protein